MFASGIPSIFIPIGGLAHGKLKTLASKSDIEIVRQPG
jgi:hypothetical protein